MTMQAEELIGARVTGGDGELVGTVEQVFNDDADGRPVWALIRAGKKDKFVPLGGSRMTRDGLNVPFESKLIMDSPEVDAGRHMSANQADELNRHFGLTVPPTAQPEEPMPGRQNIAGRTEQPVPARTQSVDQPAEWLTRAEERVDVGTEQLETGRARLRKYVDTQPIEQDVHVYHEEVELERMPLRADEQASGAPIGEDQQEVILHEQRAVFRKEAVPVERVRLVVKRVDEEKTFRDEVRKERIEVENDGGRVPAGTPRSTGRTIGR